jgi:hypothetical protein
MPSGVQQVNLAKLERRLFAPNSTAASLNRRRRNRGRRSQREDQGVEFPYLRDRGCAGASEGINQFANIAAYLTRRALEQLAIATTPSAEG